MISSLPPSGSAKARLERRSQAVARLRHPNLVRMLPLPGGAGLQPLVGEARRLADFTLPAGTFKRFELDQVVRLLLDVLSGLSALHEVVTDGEAFVHGAVCPQHVYVDEHGTARLVPLLSSHLTGSSRPEHHGYLAPERLAGERLDVRADVFSVGVMLWEALAGQRLFAEPALAAIEARLSEPLTPQLAKRDAWAQPLCAIALKAIAFAPGRRYRTALDFSHAMATAAAQQLSRVDTDAWQEEAPTPVFQPRLHLATLRPSVQPPPLPNQASAEPTGPDTAPPTTSDGATDAPSAPRRNRGRSSLWVGLAVFAAAAAWVGAYRMPRGWQKLLTEPTVSAESLSTRIAASPLAVSAPVVSAAPAPPPAAPVTPASASSPAAAAPSAAASVTPTAARPLPAPKLKPRPPRDYGI